jgi:hypothetical protein
MKRMIFGIVLFVSGLVGAITLTVAAIFAPAFCDNATGVLGSMLCFGTRLPFILLCVLGIIGLVICVYEAYFRKQ